jgi:precorrin-3B synthase
VRGPVAGEADATVRAAAAGPVIRDACPSVHEPFAQLDGALVRIRVPGGVLSSRQARRISDAASAYGTAVEITSRANLQIRGVRTGSHHLLVEELVAAGVTLGDAAADARRNVLASPTAGFDPCEVADTQPLTAVLADALVHAAGTGLSPKFGVLVDGGGAVHVRGRRQDICLGAVRLVGGSWGYEVQLGRPLQECEDAGPIVVVRADDACGLVTGALDLMAETSEAGGRMSGLVGLLGLDGVLSLLTARGGVHLSELAPSQVERVTAPSLRPIGELAQRGSGHVMIGAMPVLGRLSGQELGAIARVAEDFCDEEGGAEVRLTPWRSVVIPNVAHQRASRALQQLGQFGLAVDLADPALLVVACAGSTGCPSSFTDTQRDARAMVETLRSTQNRSGFSVHLSGCSKRCADSTTKFDVTLVGGPKPGTYEIVARPDLCGPNGLAQRPLDADDALASVLSAAGSTAT